MILEPGNNLLIVHRRLFEKDHLRFFIGRVEAYDSGIARVTGYAFGRDAVSQNFHRKSEVRTKLIGIGSGTFIVYCLPDEIEVENATFETDESGLKLDAPPDYSLNLSEWVYQH